MLPPKRIRRTFKPHHSPSRLLHHHLVTVREGEKGMSRIAAFSFFRIQKRIQKILQKFRERLNQYDPLGRVAHIPDTKIKNALHLYENIHTRGDAEALLQELFKPLKNPGEGVERNSIDHIIQTLLEEYKRPTGLD